MERLTLSNSKIQEVAQRAAVVLRSGGVVLYPTDTLYGLGADALSDQAVAKIYAIKGRDERKPLHSIVESLEMAERYGEVSACTRRLAQALPAGKLSFIVPKQGIESGIAKGVSTFGFRIPDNALCIEMIRAFGGPITATSANAAGATPERSVDSILEQLGSAAQIDLVIDAGELPLSEPSTVIDMTQPHPVILRGGAVPAADVWSALPGE